MDWPTSAIILGGVTSVSALLLKYIPGRNSNGVVTKEVCVLRHEGLDKDIKEVKAGIEKVHVRLDEIYIRLGEK